MKILFVSTLYEPHILGGAERVVQAVAEGLASRGHNCVVVTLGKHREKEVRVINDVKVYYLPVHNLYWPFQEPRASGLRRALWHALDTFNPVMGSAFGVILDEERPDVVNTHNIAGFSVSVWSKAKRRELPLVHTLHDQYLLCPRSTMFRNRVNCKKQCTACWMYSVPRRRHSRLADVVVGVSKFILDRHAAFGCFPGVRQAVVYNAYEPPASVSIASENNFKDGKVRFGFLGRLHPTKGIGELIHAFTSLTSGLAELWVGGRGERAYETCLKQLSAGNNDIKWLGFVKSEEVLSRVDVLVVPSLWQDTAPRVVQEGLTWGIPIIAARRGGLPELVPEDAGWIYEPDETGSLQSVLELFLHKLQGGIDIKPAGVETQKQFTKDEMLFGYLSAYQIARES